MPFDPNLPANGSQVRSAELRNQFNGLKTLIDAVPAGPAGQPGPPGADGNDGRGIASITQANDGSLLINLTDASTQGPFTIAGGGPPAGWAWRQMDGQDANFLGFYGPNGQGSFSIQHVPNFGGIMQLAGLRLGYDQLPTSDPGEAGRIYRDENNFLKVSAG